MLAASAPTGRQRNVGARRGATFNDVEKGDLLVFEDSAAGSRSPSTTAGRSVVLSVRPGDMIRLTSAAPNSPKRPPEQASAAAAQRGGSRPARIRRRGHDPPRMPLRCDNPAQDDEADGFRKGRIDACPR